jgi:serine/threonine protein kinase/CubicO group peptidase (beta-lactamase class C family)
MAKQPAARLPEQFGRYRIVKLLGEGGMGSVYLARDSQLDRDVALKVPQFSEEGQAELLERFRLEARAAATLHHPNICPVYEVGEIGGVHYLAMAYIDGKSLAELIRAGKSWTVRQIVALVRKLALALGETHKRGVIHRDLKPGNVMIDTRGEPVIMDFGLARRTRSRDPRLTQVGAFMGSPAYMSPEQVRGDIRAQGPGCDIYALGVILYEVLTHKLPFTGDAITLVSRILEEPPPAPSALRPEVDAAVDGICRKAMAKRIEDRYASMAELASALQEYLRDPNQSSSSVLARPASTPSALAVLQQAPRADAVLQASELGGRRSMAQAARIVPLVPEEQKPNYLDKRRNSRKRSSARSVWPWITGGTAAATLVVLPFLLIPRGETLPVPEVKDNPQVPRQAPVKVEPATRPSPDGESAPPPSGTVQTEPGWRHLFNGRDLSGWKLDGGADAWRVEHGELVFAVSDEKKQGWLLTEVEFADFRLHFDFQLEEGANSGVALRTAPNASKRLIVNIEDNTSPKWAKAPPTERTGALFELAIDRQAQMRPVGEWNRMDIELRGASLVAKVNGRETVRRHLDTEPFTKYLGAPFPVKGRIGFNHCFGGVRFKDIELQLLPPGTEPVKRVVQASAPPITPGVGATAKVLDDLMLKYRQRIGCTAATLAISQNSQPLYSRGYGWSDKERSIPARPDSLIGIAGCDAPLIAASVRMLAQTGRLGKAGLKAHLFDLLKIKPRGKGVPDGRVRSITVQHFLDLTAGWDLASFAEAAKAARAEGIRDPIPQETVLAFLMTQPLRHAPGTKQAGLCYPYVDGLRLLVQKSTGRPWLEFFQFELLRPLGIQGIVAPDSPEAKSAPAVWNVAGGGPVCAAAGSLCRFMMVFSHTGERRNPAWTGASWGGLPNSTSLMIWRPNGISAVLLFNEGTNVGNREIEAEFDKALASLLKRTP